MYLNSFSNPSWGKWILPGIGLIWFLGGYFLLQAEGLAEEILVVDAFFFALLFLGGILFLDQVFRHYSPNRKKGWLLLVFPLLLSGGLVWAHFQLLSWWFDEEPAYLKILEQGFVIRWIMLTVVNQLLALLAVVLSKLGSQEELSRREAQLSFPKKQSLLNSGSSCSRTFYSIVSIQSMPWSFQARSGLEKWFCCFPIF
ncbi:MAG: hypothetical protein O3A40_02935 [Bacteroidetes bacterium]|nr:hypothetical protein [Bacteroidota bacterium]